MKIHIMGASGSGVTTLGQKLSDTLHIPYFDSDDYFWVKTEPPFTTRREPEERNQLIASDLKVHQNWIFGGSVINWAPHWVDSFDLVVFLWVNPETRIERLKQREYERYGEVIFKDPARNAQYLEFIEWAKGYDREETTGRSLKTHESWLKKVKCPILELRDNLTPQERTYAVLTEIKALHLSTDI